MNKYWIPALLICTSPCYAQDFSRLVGTDEVEFVPMRTAGTTLGCSLTFKVIGQDHVYEQGSLVFAIGNIVFLTNPQANNVLLGLKLGLVYPLIKGQTIFPPYFAYIETPSGTTAKTKYTVDDGELPGYKIFTYQFDGAAAGILGDLMQGSSVVIGFNRVNGGLDVTLPVDISVESSEPKKDGNGYLRKHSDLARIQFTGCVKEITARVRKAQ